MALFTLVASFLAGTARVGGGMQLAMAEKTYIMVKPDGVQRGLVGNIVQR